MVDYLRREEVPVVDGMVQVPSWRPDLRCMADLAEEVARYYGYNRIETTLMRGATTMGGYSETQKLVRFHPHPGRLYLAQNRQAHQPAG